MAGRPLGSAKQGDAANMGFQCRTNPPLPIRQRAPPGTAGVRTWPTRDSSRRRPPGLTAAQVPRLKLKWAFGFPTGVSANGQPTIASGRVFVGSDNGYVYSLDAKTGCVYWSFENGSIVRNALTVGAGNRAGRREVRASSSATATPTSSRSTRRTASCCGRRKPIRTSSRASPPASAITTASSSSRSPRPRNSAAAIPTIPAARRAAASSRSTRTPASRSGRPGSCPTSRSRTRRWPTASMLYAPAGGAVWNSPTIDPVKRAVYFGTGDATTAPSPKTTDAIMAVDLDTGKLLWSYQATENDVFMGGCNGPNESEACPNPMGPDMDIGNSPILRDAAERQARADRRHQVGRHLRARSRRQRQAALPDQPARPAAQRRRPRAVRRSCGAARPTIGSPTTASAAPDSRRCSRRPASASGCSRLRRRRPAAAAHHWARPRRRFPASCSRARRTASCTRSAAADGKQLWEFTHSQRFETINRVPAHGGAISTSGAVVVDGMVYVGSGYAVGSGASGGNVLLAFGID